MSRMEVLDGYRVCCGRHEGDVAGGYVKEFTRHSNDVLLNLNELRHRNILTDATLVVGNVRLQAHTAVLIACSGFFYTLYSRREHHPAQAAGQGHQAMTLSLPDSLEPASVSLLLDFMYTSRLPLTTVSVPGVLSAATYLQMDHVADTCRAFMQNRVPGESLASLKHGTILACQPRSQEPKLEPVSPHLGSPRPSPDSPSRFSCQPNSPAESSTCNLTNQTMSNTKPTPDPKACNWKKYKYIVLNPLCAITKLKEEQPEEQRRHPPPCDGMDSTPPATVEAWSGEVPGQIERQGQASCCDGSGRAPPLVPPSSATHPTEPSGVDIKVIVPTCNSSPKSCRVESGSAKSQHPIKRESFCLSMCYSGNLSGTKTICAGVKPYQCNVCGAQFNRPANLKTHSRIHSGEKPYCCETCGARFVQVAHLRAHVLIHTGEKPYPCHTCGTRFRHLQTLKSHLRIHTGEKPYTCEKCDIHFRHKSQLRLHLRQKHGAVTNTKIRYTILADPYQPILQTC